ncbi:ABC transporter permease [Halopseudomonas sp. SMJS2]|uniref:ABC transporter permease n=1 Tax=Halopseudomonas sp. SMJS2 TaxID=3041098 RepID=UPI0032996D85
MASYILRRGLLALLVALVVSFGTFALFYFATDPAQTIAGEDAPPEMVEEIRQEYGFDRPVSVQYVAWLGGVFRGDFGESYFWKQPVGELIREHAGVTIILALSSLMVTILIALPLGIGAALRPNSWVDRFALSTAVSAQAIPNFWLGLMVIILFAVMFPIFPVSGDATWRHYVLPALVLGASSVPAVMRLTRTGLLEVLGADYIRTPGQGLHGLSVDLPSGAAQRAVASSQRARGTAWPQAGWLGGDRVGVQHERAGAPGSGIDFQFGHSDSAIVDSDLCTDLCTAHAGG